MGLAQRGCIAVQAAVAAVLGLAACERSGTATDQYWQDRKAAAEQLEFWSIEAVGSNAAPVRICTDVAMRIGFVKPSPAVRNTPCILVGRPVETRNDYVFRCELGGREWAVTSHWSGERDRDFTDAMSVASLDPPPDAYGQTRRYRRLGPCPSGWIAGDAADAQGRRVKGLGPWPAAASPPP
jgi:hypothetical protein